MVAHVWISGFVQWNTASFKQTVEIYKLMVSSRYERYHCFRMNNLSVHFFWLLHLLFVYFQLANHFFNGITFCSPSYQINIHVQQYFKSKELCNRYLFTQFWLFIKLIILLRTPHVCTFLIRFQNLFSHSFYFLNVKILRLRIYIFFNFIFILMSFAITSFAKMTVEDFETVETFLKTKSSKTETFNWFV